MRVKVRNRVKIWVRIGVRIIKIKMRVMVRSSVGVRMRMWVRVKARVRMRTYIRSG